MNRIKPLIIMQPGPRHLFWTTGVFYLWSLKDHFDFVLLVDSNYREDPQFSKLLMLESIIHVEYLPIQARIIKRHLYLAKQIEKILRYYHPAYILIYSYSYLDNQYLLHWVSKVAPDAIIYMYQSTKGTLRWEDDYMAVYAEQLLHLILKYTMLKHWIRFGEKIIKTKNYISYLLNYKLFPLITVQKMFNPPFNVLSGHPNRKALVKLRSLKNVHTLAYLDVEINGTKSFIEFKNIIQIRHPMVDCWSEVFKFLYSDIIQSDNILLVPTYGFTSRMLQESWSFSDIVENISRKWCNAIEKLLEVFPNFAIKMKLHPASQKDPIWQEILLKILERYPFISIVDPLVSAEYLVVQSKVIVGDVTSVLWWAGMLGSKIVISLDIFGYPGGDEMKYYKDIILYIKDLNELSKSIVNHTSKPLGNYPSIKEIIFGSQL